MIEKKIILLFHHHGGIGGAGLSFLHILKSIDKYNYEVIVVCPSNPRCMIQEIKKIPDVKIHETENTPIIFAHYNGGIPFFFSFRTLRNYLDIKQDKTNIANIIELYKPDIIVTNSMTTFMINKMARDRGIYNICFHRETYIKGLFGFRTSIIKRGLENCDKLIFISKYDKEQSKDVFTKKQVVYDRVEKEKYLKEHKMPALFYSKFPDKFKYILYLGGVSKLKGFHIIIDAFIKLQNPNIRLIILGSNYGKNENNNSYFNRQIIKLKKSNKLSKVYFEPSTNHPEYFYQLSDIVVFPSTKPHQSRPIYEAGFAKKPIIITEFVETSEFAKNNYNVLTFEKNNSNQLSNILRKVFDDNININHIVKNNYKLSLNNHDFSSLEKVINNDILVVNK